MDLVKDISGLFKNEFGFFNYVLLVDLFGLVKEIIVVKYFFNFWIDFGLNKEVINMVVNKFKGFFVNEVSDGVCCLRYFYLRKV